MSEALVEICIQQISNWFGYITGNDVMAVHPDLLEHCLVHPPPLLVIG